MADRQRAGITGNATMRVPITGDVNVGGRSVRELRFMPRSAFPEVGRSDVLYIDTLGECIYYWDGGEYVQLSGGGSGTDNYNSLQNRPKINNVTLEGEQTSSDLGLQSSIDDLSSIRSGAAAGATALQPEDVDTLPTDGSSNPVSSGGTYNFVNSSIATNTAYFIGTFASVEELEAYSGTVTNNDYAFVTSTDSAGNTLYNRYKYNAETQVWGFEYAVNNTAFTAAQWAAIQSGMTASDKTKLDGIEQGANKTVIDASPTSRSDNAVSSGGVHTALSGKQDTISDLSDIRSGASSGATAVQPSALNGYQTKLSGTNKLDPSYIDYDASHRAVSDNEKSTWNGKQDTISDLSTIRSGAAAGATAVQPTDMNTALAAKQDTLTFDTVPTENSTNPVTSGGVAASQAEQDAELAVIANAGAKNFAVPFNSISTTDIAVTKKSDGSYTFVCTNVSENRVIRVANIGDMPSGEFKISGVTGGSSSTYMLGLYNTSATAVKYQHTNPEESYTGDVSGFSLRVRVISGYSGTFTVYPMIRPASITDSTFQPYALPNPTLTPAAIKAVDGGSKQMMDLSKATSVTATSGVSYTLNTDGSLRVMWSIPQDSVGVIRFRGLTMRQEAAPLFLSGCPSGGGVNSFRCELRQGEDTAETTVVIDNGEGAEFSQPSGEYKFVVRVRHSTGDITFHPMICTAQDWAVSKNFVPYCPTNRELYEMIQALQNA